MTAPEEQAKRALQSAVAHHQAGRLVEAEAIYRRIVEVQPRLADAWHMLGVLAYQTGHSVTATDLISEAIALDPGKAAAHVNLGLALASCGQQDRAVAAYRRALAIQPNYAEAHNNLGASLAARGDLDEARKCYERTLVLDPNHVEAHYNLGTTLAAEDRLDEAVASCRRALTLRPDHVEAHTNLGAIFAKKGRLDEARTCYERALAIKPDHVEALNNLAGVQKDQGLLDEAIESYRRAISLNPQDARLHSNLVYTLHFHPGFDTQALHTEHRRWNQQHAAPLKSLVRPHVNDSSPARKLRIGYVSPDLREHPVGRFLLPLLAAHDRRSFEVFCYADVHDPDAVTERLRGHVAGWRSTVGLSDEQVAQTIREDRVDILVDLAMHMANNRLPLFARRPAPVQVTYLAYCSTTGMDTIDYRLTDPFLDPLGAEDGCYSERSMRLPETYWCYQPGVPTPEVSFLPALAAGRVTFGCMNNFCKVTPEVLATWARLLRAVPRSTLVLHAHEGSHRERVRVQLARDGVAAEQLRFVGYMPLVKYFEWYQSIDIGLDPFPYPGGTTTCDALWMGVPVVTLAGQSAFSRSGLSLLSNLGLPELVARSPEQYIQIAAGLARALPRLVELRATLRQRMSGSPLMDPARFTRNVESAYRSMWQHWCQNQGR